MPIRQVPNSDRQYYLIAFDKSGRERKDDPDGVMSERALKAVQAGGVSDVFLVSHGWKGDVPAAIEQYDKWIGAMTKQASDLERMRARNPSYRPLIIGLHWPSQPWGEEEVGSGGTSFGSTATAAGNAEFDAPRTAPTEEELVEQYADRLSDSDKPDPELREQLRKVFASARENIAPFKLPDEIVAAYKKIDVLAGLGSGALGGPPDADRAEFDPQRAYRATKPVAASFGDGFLGGLLSPLRQLSFWKMKKRAQKFGEDGAAPLLESLQQAAGEKVRFHVAGHSFGCIVASALLRGRDAQAQRRPVHSVSLLQGALSLWSYCSKIEQSNNEPGYFSSVLSARRVSGPIITSQSRFDKAVGFWYPKAAGAAGQVSYAPGLGDLPKFGAIGTFGVQGPDTNATHMDMLPVSGSYGFKGGQVYNLNGDQYIKNGGGFSGAHSDIAHPEVAHAVWEAVLAE
jgi:hypothetical protein